MRLRIVWLALAVVVAACGGSGDESPAAPLSTQQPVPAAKDRTPATPVTTTATAAPSSSTAATTTLVPPTTTTTEPPPPPVLGSRDEPLAVGSVARLGDWVIRVASLTPDGTADVTAENDFNDPPGPGEQFFLAGLEATYVGEDSSTFWFDMSLKVVGASNVAYDSFDAYCGVVPDDITESGETFRGGTITGNACWKIDAADADSLVLIAEPLLLFGEERAFLSLDPDATPLDATTAIIDPAPIAADGVAVGEAVRVGDWLVEVVSVTPDATDEVLAYNDFNDPPGPGEQFFMVELAASYEGTESSTFWFDVTLKTVGSSNVAYDSFDAYCGVVPDGITDIGEVFPGGTISGNACWRIDAADGASLVLIAEPGFAFDAERVFFTLGS